MLIYLLASGTPFIYGVSSGDPTDSSVVIWTKVEEYPFAYVHYQVAEDKDFRKIVDSGTVKTDKSRDFTVKVLVKGLEPGKTYYYRFRYKNRRTGKVYYSVVGKTHTLPKETDRFRIALVSCQHFSAGYFTVYKYILEDGADLILHLGDFIYEFPVYERDVVRADVIAYVDELEEYRSKYKLTLTDPYIKEALRNIPLVAIWDDHEVVNDYSGKTMRYYNRKRLYDAYKAFFEYMPIMEQNVEKDRWRIYRKFKVGNLLEIFMIDGRQYRDEDVCRPTWDPPERCTKLSFAEGRTYLGEEQRDWLIEGVVNSKAIWKLIGNNTMMMDFRKDGKVLFVDQWDGFYWEKAYILRKFLKHGVKNIIVGTGDTHVFYFGDVKVDGKKVATEVITAGVSSPGSLKKLSDKILKQNPHIKYTNSDYRGYVLMDFYKDRVEVFMYAIEDVKKPDGKRKLLKKFVIERE